MGVSFIISSNWGSISVIFFYKNGIDVILVHQIRRALFFFLFKKKKKIGLAVGTRVNILFKRLPKNSNHDNKSYSASFLEKWNQYPFTNTLIKSERRTPKKKKRVIVPIWVTIKIKKLVVIFSYQVGLVSVGLKPWAAPIATIKFLACLLIENRFCPDALLQHHLPAIYPQSMPRSTKPNKGQFHSAYFVFTIKLGFKIILHWASWRK